jgi:hypothetical protein
MKVHREGVHTLDHHVQPQVKLVPAKQQGPLSNNKVLW